MPERAHGAAWGAGEPIITEKAAVTGITERMAG
jgi:hypothetical protein